MYLGLLVEDTYSKCRDLIAELMKFQHTNLTYKMRTVRHEKNSSHDRFSTNDIKSKVKFGALVLNAAVQEPIICTVLQFGGKYWGLAKYIEVVQDFSKSGFVSEDSELIKSTNIVFKMNSFPLY